MSCRSIILLICMFMAVSLATLDPDSTKERSVMESVREVKQEAAEELGALLDAGEPGVEGAALRHLLAYLYTLRAPRLPPGAATQLLAAAHRLGLPALQADCERQVAAQLSVETAASAAVLAVKHSATHLRDAAVNFIKDHRIKVLATKGWADVLVNQPKEAAEVSHLLADRLAEICAPDTMEAESSSTVEAGTNPTIEAETTPTMEAETTNTMEAGTTPTIEAETTPTMEAETSSTMEAETAASTQPRSAASQTPATAAPPLAACPTAPLDEATVSLLRSLSGEDRDSRLIQAAQRGAVGELRALLAAGADLQGRDEYGETALHWAAMRGHVEAARCLLVAGAQVDATDSWQRTPLHGAAVWGYAAEARLLLAASADPNARNEDGDTPLHLAAIFGRADVVAALLDAGADRGARNAEGQTPLDEARRRGYQHLFEVLAQR